MQGPLMLSSCNSLKRPVFVSLPLTLKWCIYFSDKDRKNIFSELIGKELAAENVPSGVPAILRGR